MSKIIGNNQKTSLLSTFQIGQKKKVHAGNKQELSIFNAIDANNDGIISKNEMKGIVKGKVKGSNGKLIEKDFIKLKNLPNQRSLVVDEQGRQWVMSHDGIILKQEYVENPTKFKEAQTYNRNVNIRKNAENLAKNFYQIADDNSGLQSMRKMQNLLDKNINADNIVAFLDSYAKENIRKEDSSIIDTVTSETGAGGTIQQKKVLMTIMNKLCAAAQKAGVSAGDIQKAKKDFETSLDKEFSATLRRTNPKDMEKAIDFLRGAIVAKQNGGSEMTDAEAVNTLKKDAVGTHNEAVKSYKDARNEEGWAASVGDTVCGWFGCTTVEDMDKKLGANASAVRGLAKAKTVAEFKTKYKEVFGIEFDKNKIAARDKALGNYQQANALSSTIKLTNEILKNSGYKDYSSLRNEIKTKFKLDDKTVDTIIKNYGLTNNKNINSDTDRKAMLVKFLQETQINSADTYRGLTKGKTLEQMGKDLDLLNKSAFGTTDIAKDVADFNQNMVVTEMVTEGVFEVAGTVALQFVPGLGQMAAARLAVSAAKWGTKAVKIANAAAKAEKAFATVSKVQQGAGFTSKVAAKSAQIGSQMATAGIATATVDFSNGDETKAVMKKTLMNMSFAGVGAGASQLAPKIMKSFGIADKALANEIAEEIINAAGSLGISKLAGDEYGSTDAFVDIATGIVMARISHIKGGKPDVNATAATKPHLQDNGIEIPTQKEANIPDAVPVHSSTNTITETNINTTAKAANKQSIIEKYANNPELISNLSNQEKNALSSEIDNIIGNAYAGKLDNPEITLQNLEAVLKQLGDNETLDMLNVIRKKLNIESPKISTEIDTNAVSNTPADFDINSVIKSNDSEMIKQAKTELYNEIKNKGLSDDEIKSILRHVNEENLPLAKKIIADKEISADKADIILSWSDKDNLAVSEKLYFDNSISDVTAERIYMQLRPENTFFADYLLSDANYPKDKIANAMLFVKDKESIAKLLTSNSEFKPDYTIDILAGVNKDNYQLIENCCKNYKDLGISPQQIGRISTGKSTLEDLQIINKTYGIENTAKFDNNDYDLATDFLPYVGKQNISELSKTEKKEMLMKILMNKNKIENNHLGNVCPLIPVDSNGYESSIRKITQSLNLNTPPLTPSQVAAFDSNLKELSNSLKTIDLSELHQLDLSVPHQEFISNVQNIMKNLPPSEQAKIQDYFGFRIENGKLTGYPNISAKSLADFEITDKASIEALNRMQPEIERYTNSNFITTNDIPELNRMLKTLSKDMPEFYNQIDGSSTPVKTIKSLQQVVQSPKFEGLSESDKKVLMLATLLHNSDKASGSSMESAFDAYFISKKFGISDAEAQKVYKIVQSADLVEQFMNTSKTKKSPFYLARTEREELIDTFAFNLKEGNDFELAQMLYSTKENANFTRNFDKLLQQRIHDMQTTDFVLPQTTKETYLQHAKQQAISRDGVTYNVNVVNSEDINNFYAFIHTPEAGYVTGGSRSANFANFEIFKDFADDKVICTSYVTNGKAALVNEYHHGFIFDVANDHQYVGYGRDIWSNSKQLSEMRSEYFYPSGIKNGGVEKYSQRTMISDALKSNLLGEDYNTLTNTFKTKKDAIIEKYETELTQLESKRKVLIQEKVGSGAITREQYLKLKDLPEFKEIDTQISQIKQAQNTEINNLPEFAQIKAADDMYIQRLKKLKEELGSNTLTIENLEKIDPEFAQAYKKLLDAPKSDDAPFLLNPEHHNEVLVSNPKITALYTDDINNIPAEYLKKAQEEGLPIVIIKA